MGIRKRVRTKWKAERKEQIRKISKNRLKKKLKAQAAGSEKKAPAKAKENKEA